MTPQPSGDALSGELADTVYTILVEECGAREDMRYGFIGYMAGNDGYGQSWREWRFQGLLGYGGKCYFDGRSRLYVDCYPEDMNAERQQIIEQVNRWLAVEMAERAQPSVAPRKVED